jgi:hypothetical protein
MIGWDQAAAQLAEQKRRTDLTEAGQQEQIRVNQIQHGTGTPGTSGFVPGTEQQKIGLMQQELAKKPPIPKFQQVINPSDVVMSKQMTAKQYGEGALKVLEPMFNTINEVATANPTTTNWDAYQTSKSSYAGQKAEMAGRGEKYIMSPEFEKLTPQQQQGFKDLYNAMMTDPDGSVFYDSGVFRETVASKKMVESNSKAEILAQAITARAANAHQVQELTSPDGKSAQKFQWNPESQRYDIPLGPPYTVKSQVPRANAPQQNQVDILAAGILDGSIDPNAISKRGNLQGSVWAKVKEINPSFNIVNAGAGAKFTASTATMQSKALLNAIDPLLTKLEQTGAVLGNSSLPLYNKAVNYLKEQTGSADIVGFNNLRDDVVAEVERGLLGTGVLSDNKYLRAVKNVNSAQTYPQLQAAVKNIKTVIKARLESLAAGPNAPTPYVEQNRRATDTGKKPLSAY